MEVAQFASDAMLALTPSDDVTAERGNKLRRLFITGNFFLK
jgi:hypothetical protein